MRVNICIFLIFLIFFKILHIIGKNIKRVNIHILFEKQFLNVPRRLYRPKNLKTR